MDTKAVLRLGGTYFMLCFSDQEIRQGHRRISQAEIHATLHTGWTINYIHATTFETTIHDGGAKAWLPSITRTKSND